ncbi:methylated-DNA--[protein]-cysteine S-methyltransferase [Denitrovibrio acetiphilus]|nr:methylated-DNA--[protein]-cysteine S-methyltransferase [Denitrovibrio acetiphilus]
MSDYDRIAEAIRYIQTNSKVQPSLEEIAAHMGLSPYHFQRLFTQWAGISPKRFLQFITLESAKLLLKKTSIMETSYELGMSGPSRLHDLFITTDGVTPGEYKSSGEGLTINYGCHETPFGECLLAQTERGVCHLAFIDDNLAEELDNLKNRWNKSDVVRNDDITAETSEMIFKNKSVPLHLKGTNFQIRVWRALLEIPEGHLTTYRRIAEKIGSSSSSRAVGSAAGKNSIGYLIPCHRVLRTTGELGGYRWGLERKRIIIAYEAAQQDQD